MRWYQLVAWIGVAWLAVALLLTPLVALFIRSGKRLQIRAERRWWAQRSRTPVPSGSTRDSEPRAQDLTSTREPHAKPRRRFLQ
jgi:hypothetical protein